MGVVAIDHEGEELWRTLDIEKLIPAGERDTPRWRTIRSKKFAVVADSVFVSNTLFDSLWAFSLPRPDSIRSMPLNVAGYVPPSMPREDFYGETAVIRWATAQMRAWNVVGDGELLLIPFVLGDYPVDGSRSLAALRDPAGRWHTLTDTPALIKAVGRTIYTFERPDLEDMVIGVYHWRSE
jgi:hypothetical protein